MAAAASNSASQPLCGVLGVQCRVASASPAEQGAASTRVTQRALGADRSDGVLENGYAGLAQCVLSSAKSGVDPPRRCQGAVGALRNVVGLSDEVRIGHASVKF